jgi:2-polyprenyl-3-methyl-5-hydroxy-6-metoxy-1,4-benzoquinol methylase
VARYDTHIDLANRNVSHTQIVELVGSHKRVLDVGCATGYVAAGLSARNCRVWGVDIDAEAAENARPHLEELVIANLETQPLTELFDRGSFDAVVFGDVLEHLVDPGRALNDAVALLADGGQVVVSIPNVTHGSLRLSLLRGQWRYTTVGLLDETHVRFFDRAGVGRLFTGAGLSVSHLRGIMVDPLQTEVEVRPAELPPGFIEWVRDQPDALVYQFIASAHVTGPDDDGALPELEPVVPLDQVRQVDEFSVRHREDLETLQHVQNLADIGRAQEHEMLRVRDHIIGLEAEAASSRTRAARLKKDLEVSERRLKVRTKRLGAARRRVRSLRKRLRTAEQRAEREVRSSRTWRVGRAVTAPARIFRRGA